MKWRPGEDDKKYIEDTVRSQLVDSEDLCRLLMVAMATELDRPPPRPCWRRDEQYDQMTSSHVVQCSAGPVLTRGDRDDHGDTAPCDVTGTTHNAVHETHRN